MSKTHTSQADDLDAELDAYLLNKKTTPVVSKSASDGIDLFGSVSEKKKSFLQRLLIRLFPFLNRLTY